MNTAAPAPAPADTDDARCTIGRAKTVHRATRLDGRIVGTACGTDRYRNARSAFSPVPQAWDVDCRRCCESPAPAAPAPAASVAGTCSEGHRIPASNRGVCLLCSPCG